MELRRNHHLIRYFPKTGSDFFHELKSHEDQIPRLVALLAEYKPRVGLRDSGSA